MNKLYEWESEAIDHIGYLLSGINDVLGSFRLWRRLMVSSDRSSLDFDRQELFQRLTEFEIRIASRYSTPWGRIKKELSECHYLVEKIRDRRK